MVYLLKYEEDKMKRKQAMKEIWTLEPDATIVFKSKPKGAEPKDFKIQKPSLIRQKTKHPRYWTDMEPEHVYTPEQVRSYHKNKM